MQKGTFGLCFVIFYVVLSAVVVLMTISVIIYVITTICYQSYCFFLLVNNDVLIRGWDSIHLPPPLLNFDLQ